MDTKKQGFNEWARSEEISKDVIKKITDMRSTDPVKIVKKAKTLPEVIEELGKIAAEWGGVTESIRQLDKNGRIREMSVTIKFTAV